LPKTESHVLTADIGETNSRMEPARALKCGQFAVINKDSVIVISQPLIGNQ
jgi:hypothetical protein